MGQRLVITISKNGKRLANAYYHWSGYSESAVTITARIVSVYNAIPKSYTDLQRAVAMLVATEAGIDSASVSNKEIGTFPRCVSRNEGIISTTEEGMDESLAWAEATVNIELNDLFINFCAFWERPMATKDDVDELLEEMGDTDFNIDDHCIDLPSELKAKEDSICCNFNNFNVLFDLVTKARQNENYIRYKDEFNTNHYLQLIY